jgi:hypothetical protein
MFLWARARGLDLAVARTMAIQALVLAQVAYLVSISQVSKGGWRQLRRAPLRAPVLLGGIATALLLQLGFSQLSWMNGWFDTAPLTPGQALLCAGSLLVMLPVAWVAERCDPTTGVVSRG